MPTANDIGWLRYIEATGIVFDQPIYSIDATELGRVAQREPRLLVKFDTPDQLPKPLKDAGYTVIPVRNGQYNLIKGNLFVEVPPCPQQGNFQPITSFPLETAGRGSSESQYI